MIKEGFSDDSRAVARWFHLRGVEPQVMTIVQNNFVHFKGHYIDRKMRLCDGENCKFCSAGIGSQRRYVFDVVLLPLGVQVLYEASESIALQIRDIISVNNYGERVYFEVSRLSVSKQSNCKVTRAYPQTKIEMNRYLKQDLPRILHEQEDFFSNNKFPVPKNDITEVENWRRYAEKK